MKTAIGKIYWRKIVSGEKTFDQVRESAKESVKQWACEDVEDGVITPELYFYYIGETYNDPIADNDTSIVK